MGMLHPPISPEHPCDGDAELTANPATARLAVLFHHPAHLGEVVPTIIPARCS